MKPVRFDYERPADLDAAVALLQDDSLSIKLLAGGQSLGPMLNMRLVQPDLLVDISALDALRRVDERSDEIVVGACVTHADFEDRRVPDVTAGALPSVARGIAYRAVRNRGTVGGSLTHADPSADWISILSAVGAGVTLRGASGVREVRVQDYILGALSADLQPGEILEAVRIPRCGPRTRWGYYKSCRKTGEFAHAIGAVFFDPDRNVCRAVIGATEARPIVLDDARPLFGGSLRDFTTATFDADAVSDAIAAAGMSDPLDRRTHVVALRRAVQQAEAA